MEKVQSCLQWGRDEGHCPEFLLRVKAQSRPAPGQFSVCSQRLPIAVLRYAGSLLECVGSLYAAMGHAAVKAPWPWTEQVCAPCKCGPLWGRERESERASLVLLERSLLQAPVATSPTWSHAPCREIVHELMGKCVTRWVGGGLLCSPGIIRFGLGKDQKLFQNDQSTSQVFMGFGWVYMPELDWQASMAQHLPLCSPTIQYWRGGGRSVNPFGGALLQYPGVGSCSFLVDITGSCPQLIKFYV